jgi:hypothetical protein
VKKSSIISQKSCLSLFSGITITETQRKAREKWLDLLENDKLEKEKENYPVFMNTILRDLLGYPEELIEKAYEQKNVEFAFKDPNGEWSTLFEAKGHSTKDLYANQGRIKKNQQTPIKQTYDNLGRFEFIKYGVCTNYQKFILMDINLKFSALQEFDFKSTKNNDEKLKEFIGIFGYTTLVINKDISKFKKNSDDADKELSTEFYKLFHETRLMLIKAFTEKEGVQEGEAIYSAQRFLERILFLFFALDNGLIPNSRLFTERILNQLRLKQCTEDSTKIFNDIKLLFNGLDKGSKILGIDGFNGELFSGKFPDKIFFLDYQSKEFFANEIMNSKLSKELKLHGESAKIWKEFGKDVNPIIRNLLIMDSRDFNSELNVTILGHILEQSLDDLSEFQKTGELKRKIDGVFYTPPDLTDYVCRNTIIPYLSKSDTNDVQELIFEYQDNIEQLEKKLEEIKIIDPACGSGAFLINSAQILLEITEGIEKIKNTEKNQITSGTLDEWQQEQEASKIIENNIFGVDINPDSVKISKLSLFLMMAKPGEKLKNLSNNIIHKNSLINDKKIDPTAMIWEKEFPEIIKNGGFDIVLGNPPWQEVQPNIDEFFAPQKKIKLLMLTKIPNNKKPFSKLTKKEKYSLIDEVCLMDEKIKNQYDEYLEQYYNQKNYFIDPENYKYQVSRIRGKTVAGIGINLYKLFVEQANTILKDKGHLAFVLPSGIYSHAGSISLRKLLLEEYSIKEFVGFHNKKRIFRDVHAQEKFCTIICKKGEPTTKFLASFHVKDITELENFRNFAFEYDAEFIRKTSSDQLIFLECIDKEQLQIFQKLFKFPFLHSDEWNLKSSREFNMSDDAHFFHEAQIGPPLFKGEMIHMFTDSFAPPIFWLDEKEGRDELVRKEIKRLKKVSSEITPQLHMDHYRFVWRKLTHATNTRTLITTILPPNVFLADSLYFIHPVIFDGTQYKKQFSYEELLFLCGICNSFVVDYIPRNKIDSNFTIQHFLDLPIPKFDDKNILHKKIMENSSKLICTTKDYDKLREEVEISEFVTDPNKRLGLEAQINACAAKIYGLSKDELEYILKLFQGNEKLKELTLDEFSFL